MNARTQRWCGCGLAALVVVAWGTVGIAQPADPAYGTWKLNVAKSKYSPGPAPKSGLVTFEAAGTGRKVSVEVVPADGTALKWGYTGSFDGKEYRVTGTNPDADMVVLERVSASSTKSTWKKDGKVTTSNVLTVAADGTTLTVVSTGMNAKGQKVSNTQVFEK